MTSNPQSYWLVVVVGQGTTIQVETYQYVSPGRSEAMGAAVETFLKSYPFHSIRNAKAHDITNHVRLYVHANPDPTWVPGSSEAS